MIVRSLRMSLRFILPLALVLGLFAYIVVPLLDNITLRWYVRDLDSRAELLAGTLRPSLTDYLPAQDATRIGELFQGATRDERLIAIGFCDNAGHLLYQSAQYPASIGCWSTPPTGGLYKSLAQLPQGQVHLSETPVMQDASQLGRLVLVQDMSFVERRNTDTKRFIFAFLAVLAVLISLMTVFVAHLSWRGWLSAVKDILRGELLPKSNGAVATATAPAAAPAPPPEMQPLIGDLRELLQDYHLERLSDSGWSSAWTPDKLRALLDADLRGDQVLVVSNREPYIHTKTDDGSGNIRVQRPASGRDRAGAGRNAAADRRPARTAAGIPPGAPGRKQWLDLGMDT